MTNLTLAQSYLVKATKRLKILPVLLAEDAFSDVVREAQEIVELALKGMLRYVGVEPPKWHDVGGPLLEFSDRFSREIQEHLPRLADISHWLRKEREFSFYGDVDFVPTQEYSREDALRAISDAEFVVRITTQVVSPGPRGSL